MQLVLRLANPQDAEKILQVHRSAIRALAIKHYPQTTIEKWASPITPDKVQDYVQRLSSEEILTVVAEQDGEIIGFGTIVEPQNELRALFVSPSVSRTGIGGKILKQLEKIAKERGMTELILSSSLNAEAFYKTNGYTILSRGQYTTRSGLTLDCVNMRKTL